MAEEKRETNLRTAEGALYYAEMHRAMVERMFASADAEGEELSPFAVLLVTIDPETGAQMPEGGVLPIMNATEFREAHKDLFAETMRLAAADFGAVGVIFTSEVWYVEGLGSDEEYRRWAEAHPGRSLGQYPGARERIFMTLEHRTAGMAMWVADIEGKDRPRRMGPWRRLEDAKSYSGRFARILPEGWMS